MNSNRTDVSQTEKESNKKLVERFPFLIPRNPWTGHKVTEDIVRDCDYDYEYTLLDDMPKGWRIAFGEEMCQEIMDELVEHGIADEYYPIQIKEKFGGLRWYDVGGTKEIYEIIHKYSRISERTCIVCGKPATKISKGWISPYCDECYEKHIAKWRGNDEDYFWTLQEYFEDEE